MEFGAEAAELASRARAAVAAKVQELIDAGFEVGVLSADLRG